MCGEKKKRKMNWEQNLEYIQFVVVVVVVYLYVYVLLSINRKYLNGEMKIDLNSSATTKEALRTQQTIQIQPLGYISDRIA